MVLLQNGYRTGVRSPIVTFLKAIAKPVRIRFSMMSTSSLARQVALEELSNVVEKGQNVSRRGMTM